MVCEKELATLKNQHYKLQSVLADRNNELHIFKDIFVDYTNKIEELSDHLSSTDQECCELENENMEIYKQKLEMEKMLEQLVFVSDENENLKQSVKISIAKSVFWRRKK